MRRRIFSLFSHFSTDYVLHTHGFAGNLLHTTFCNYTIIFHYHSRWPMNNLGIFLKRLGALIKCFTMYPSLATNQSKGNKEATFLSLVDLRNFNNWSKLSRNILNLLMGHRESNRKLRWKINNITPSRLPGNLVCVKNVISTEIGK